MKIIIYINNLRFITLAGFVFMTIVFIALESPETRAADETFLHGKKIFKKCVHCHTYKQSQGHRIGPNLYGMFGRKAGKVADYDFSEAWKNADFVWTDETLDTYLLAPHKMIPNNRMPFNGLSRAKDRKALIAYLKVIVNP